jgi:uncharacterized protein (TIGR02001 family)
MKKPALLLAALLTGASLSADTAPAPAAAPASSYSITADFTYATKYVFRGVQYAEGAFQPSVKVTSGDFYAGAWISAPVDKGYELEIDYYAGYGIKLQNGWALDAGLTAYSYPGLNGGGDKVTWEPYLGLNGSFGAVTSGTYAYYDLTLKVFTVQEALGYSIPIDDKTSMNWTATIGRAEPKSGSGYTYYGLGVAIPYKLSDKATVTVGAQYADHDIDGLDGNHFWGTLGFTYAF